MTCRMPMVVIVNVNGMLDGQMWHEQGHVYPSPMAPPAGVWFLHLHSTPRDPRPAKASVWPRQEISDRRAEQCSLTHSASVAAVAHSLTSFTYTTTLSPDLGKMAEAQQGTFAVKVAFLPRRLQTFISPSLLSGAKP